MSGHGIAQCVRSDTAAIADAVKRMLEGDPAIEAGVRAGRALAARHEPAELTARLGARLGLDPRGRRAAA
jgi:hypothetical protein